MIRWRSVFGRAGVYALATSTVFLSLLPIMWLVLTSFRPSIEITSPRLMLSSISPVIPALN